MSSFLFNFGGKKKRKDRRQWSLLCIISLFKQRMAHCHEHKKISDTINKKRAFSLIEYQ
jgi:hypothetical protein